MGNRTIVFILSMRTPHMRVLMLHCYIAGIELRIIAFDNVLTIPYILLINFYQ